MDPHSKSWAGSFAFSSEISICQGQVTLKGSETSQQLEKILSLSATSSLNAGVVVQEGDVSIYFSDSFCVISKHSHSLWDVSLPSHTTRIYWMRSSTFARVIMVQYAQSPFIIFSKYHFIHPCLCAFTETALNSHVHLRFQKNLGHIWYLCICYICEGSCEQFQSVET